MVKKLWYWLVDTPEGLMTVKVEGTELVRDLKIEIWRTNTDIPCRASQLQLYSTQSGDRWLRLENPLDDDIAEVLSREQLDELLTISNVFKNLPKSDVLHVLVVVPPPYGITWVWTEATTVSRLDFSGKTVRLSSDFLDGSGLQMPLYRDEMVLFRRNAVDQLWGEIQRSAINLKATLLIHGPTVSGKSVAAYAFAAGLVDFSQWNVLWIRYVGGDPILKLVQFREGKKSTCRISIIDLPVVISNVLDGLESPMQEPIVFLDGDVNETVQPIFDCCCAWAACANDKRHLVAVTSMATALDKTGHEATNVIARTISRLATKSGTSCESIECDCQSIVGCGRT